MGKIVIAAYAAFWDVAVLITFAFELLSTGNITLAAHAERTVSALDVLVMLSAMTANLLTVGYVLSGWAAELLE